MRSALVPVVQFFFHRILGVVGRHFDGQLFPQLLLIGIRLFAMTTLFSFITLPVEIDAKAVGTGMVEKSRNYQCVR